MRPIIFVLYKLYIPQVAWAGCCLGLKSTVQPTQKTLVLDSRQQSIRSAQAHHESAQAHNAKNEVQLATAQSHQALLQGPACQKFDALELHWLISIFFFNKKEINLHKLNMFISFRRWSMYKSQHWSIVLELEKCTKKKKKNKFQMLYLDALLANIYLLSSCHLSTRSSGIVKL